MNYVIAFFGSILWNFALFSIAKNKCDKEDIEFPYMKYCKANWDNWTLTTLCAPIMVWYLVDIVALVNYLLTNLNVQLPMLEIYYLGAGVVSELILFGIFKLLGLKESLVAPVHKD